MRNRAISTVADVSLAIVLLVAAMAILVTVADEREEEHEPVTAAHTAETVGAATINATYSVEPVLEEADSDVDDYSTDDLRRVTHGPITGQVASGAVANVTFDVHREPRLLSQAGTEYDAAIDEAVQASLVASSFDTNLQAVWEPFENASIRGTSEAGRQPPPRADVSLTTMTVPSQIPPVRDDAIDAVDGGDGYNAVADVVAEAVVQGYLPEFEAQRALESSGVERELVVHRYRQMATRIQGTAVDDQEIAENLERTSADAAAANEHLVANLAEQLREEMASEFDTPKSAAQAVSTGEVTISIRTWDG